MNERGARDPLAMAQAVFEVRGYLVVTTGRVYTIGEVETRIDWRIDGFKPVFRDDVKVVVIAITDLADFLEQGRLLGLTALTPPDEVLNYYRVIAE
jgi:hypothetical protein